MRMPIDQPCAWYGAAMANSSRWIRALGNEQITEIDRSLAQFKAEGLPWKAADETTFPLSGFTELLTDIRHELEEGTGVVRLSGLPVARYGPDELHAIWGAIGNHVGTPVSQSLHGERQMLIEDAGRLAASYGELEDYNNFRSARARAFSTAGLRFHTDRCDVVGLLCVRQAIKGGHSDVASAVTVHNEMLRRRPDLVEALYQAYPRSRFGEEADDTSIWYPLPIFAMESGKFSSHYSRTYIEAAQLNPDVPRLTADQREAMDLLGETAAEVAFEMTFAPGDIQFLNNHVVYHARGPYEDAPGPDTGRLLVRQWLSMPDSRPLPAGHEVLFGSAVAGALRGGIWPLAERPIPM
jgi:hypothetical protein